MGNLGSKLDLNPANYPHYGISHDLAYLHSLKPSILWCSQEQQMKVADAVTRRYAGNPDFCLRTAQDLPPEVGGVWNTTAIGNMAFLAARSHARFRFVYAAYYDKLVRQLAERHAGDVSASEREDLAQAELPEPRPEVAAFGV